MYTQSSFVQALEGPSEEVEQSFDRICCDIRHSDVEVLEYGPISESAFGVWSMSRLQPHGATAALIRPDLSDEEFAEAAVAALRRMAALLQASEGADRIRSAAA